SVMRDIQIRVLGCTVPTPELKNDINSVVNAVYEDSMIKACVNQQMSFCFDVKISDSTINMSLTDNSTIAAPGSVLNYINNFSDSVRGCFTWTPTGADTGLKILVVNVQACNNNSQIPPITQSFTLPVYIWAPTKTIPDTVICGTDSLQLNVT